MQSDKKIAQLNSSFELGSFGIDSGIRISSFKFPAYPAAMTLFEKIIAKQIPAKIAFEDDQYIAIHDVDPQAPAHLLVIPKKVIPSLNDIKPEDVELVGGLFPLASKLMNQLGYRDFRTVFNCGAGAQQTVFHLHLHVLGGRAFTWPPG